MAYEEALSAISRPAGASLTGKFGFAGIINSSGAVIVQTSAGGVVSGVIYTEPPSGDAVRLIRGGVAKCVAGAAVAQGADVQVDAAGKFITKGAGLKVGVALQAAAAADEMIPVMLAV